MGPRARPSDEICKSGIVDEMLVTNTSSSIAKVIITRLQTLFSFGFWYNIAPTKTVRSPTMNEFWTSMFVMK